SAHDVVIPNNFNVTVNTSAVCKSLTISGGSNSNTVTVSGSNSITVSGTVSIGAGTGNNDNITLAVGSGSLTCSSITIAATGNSNRTSQVTLSTGTITVSGNVTMNDLNNDFVFTNTGTLKIGGTMSGGTLVASTGTIEYYGDGTGGTSSNQTIGNYSYNNLKTSGNGTKTLAANTTMNGTLTINAGTTLALSTFSLNAPASMELQIGSSASSITGSGLLTLGGDVTITKISGSGVGAIISCPVALNNGSTRTFTVPDETTSANDLTISGTISTSGALVKSGSGTLVLSGNNSYSGGTTLNGGALTISHTNALGSVSGALSVSSGTLVNIGANVTVGNLTLGGLGTANGTWGNTGSGATFINTTYFRLSNRITVSNDTRVTPSVSITVGTYTYNGLTQGPSVATNTGTGTSYSFSYSGTGYGPSTTAPTNAGNYTVVATVAASTDGFYKAASSSSTAFTINKVILTITANNQTVSYGTAAATVTGAGSYTATGFVNGENASVISGSASYTTNYTTTTNAGTTGITITPVITGLSATNYSFTAANGTITINRALLTITASNQTVSYGTAVATVTGAGSYTATGFVNGQNASVISGSASYTTNYTTT
ncbi:MAG: beta strand repeat-containing protein, partial [Lacibacter sp.]